MNVAAGQNAADCRDRLRMHMRITTGQVRPGCWEHFETAYLEHIEGRPARGLRARWLARSTTDPETFFTIALWDSLPDLEAYERSDAVRREVLKHIAPYIKGVSNAYHCAVRHDLPLTVPELIALFHQRAPGTHQLAAPGARGPGADR